MAIIACGRACRAAEAVAVFDRMLDHGWVPCLTTYTALMSLFCRVGALAEAVIVFEGMKSAHVAPNTITYSSLINGCEKAGNLSAAFLYFEEMLVRCHMQVDHPSNSVKFVRLPALRSSCSEAKHVTGCWCAACDSLYVPASCLVHHRPVSSLRGGTARLLAA